MEEVLWQGSTVLWEPTNEILGFKLVGRGGSQERTPPKLYIKEAWRVQSWKSLNISPRQRKYMEKSGC